jgi:hypothetical protein
MAKDSKPRIERDSGEDPITCTVWGEVKISVRPGDYEGITVAMGESRTAEDNVKSRRKVRRDILAECEEAVLRKANEIKRDW